MALLVAVVKVANGLVASAASADSVVNEVKKASPAKGVAVAVVLKVDAEPMVDLAAPVVGVAKVVPEAVASAARADVVDSAAAQVVPADKVAAEDSVADRGARAAEVAVPKC